MWRDAVNEIRLRPGRFAATFFAIAIAVAFLVAVSVFTTTESRALALNSVLPASQADVVVTQISDPEHSLETVAGVGSVEAVTAIGYAGADTLTSGGRSINVILYGTPDEAFRWAEASEGRYPELPDEVALSADAADELQVGVGDVVERFDDQATVVGITDDARSLFFATGYVAAEDQSAYAAELAVISAGGVDGTVDDVSAALREAGIDAQVLSADQYREEAIDELMGDFDVFAAIAQGFGGIAMLVGAIIIANTFTILLTQRRRQIALLRAVGASTGQVVGRLVVEGFFVGLLGSLVGVLLGIGVAAIGATVTGSIFWGLHVEYTRLIWPMLAGVIVTLVASLAPSISAAAVKPLEALQTVPTPKAAKRIGAVRAVVCLLFLGVGIWCFLNSREGDLALVWAVGAGAALSVAVLAGAAFYVAPAIRLLGKIFGGISPTVRLALSNAARNPRRASATAVALMLAVGLTVTLQVGVATARESGQASIDQEFPIDVAIGISYGEPVDAELPPELAEELEQLGAVEALAEIPTKIVELSGSPLTILERDAAYEEFGIDGGEIPADEAWGLAYFGGEFVVPTVDGEETLRSRDADGLPYGSFAVAPETFERIDAEELDQQVWLKMRDRSSSTDLNAIMTVIERYDVQVLDSGAQIASLFEQVIDIVMIVLTALLGVAVVIALVGVGNTLGLSVLERQRESALLRALGMQRSGLRTMLLIEAMALMLVGVLVGVVAGAFFGWMGVTSVVAMVPDPDSFPVRFSIDVWYTVGLIAVCAAAAALASILPGRRAARATPTEALAVD